MTCTLGMHDTTVHLTCISDPVRLYRGCDGGKMYRGDDGGKMYRGCDGGKMYRGRGADRMSIMRASHFHYMKVSSYIRKSLGC